jgi:hypothetical protein
LLGVGAWLNPGPNSSTHFFLALSQDFGEYAIDRIAAL